MPSRATKYEKLKAIPSPDDDKREEVRNQLAAEYYSIVQDVAERVAPKLKEITVDECTSYGVDGLYDCIDKFDLSKFENHLEQKKIIGYQAELQVLKYEIDRIEKFLIKDLRKGKACKKAALTSILPCVSSPLNKDTFITL